MVMQALTRYYDLLAEDPDSPVARQGYSTANVSFALVLSEQGELVAIEPLFQKVTRGRKEFDAPRRMVVPEQGKRSVNILSHFLCDGSAYVLGISDKDEKDPEFSQRRFADFRDLHLRLLSEVSCPEARAVAAFFRSFDPRVARDHPVIAGKLAELLGGGNIVFKVEGCPGFAHEADEIRRAWEASQSVGTGQPVGQCLVTGEPGPITRVHNNIKGVRGAQSSGATLVGFNAPAYESYGRSQGMNAPTSERAAFAYTTMLNYLLSDESGNPRLVLGDTTVVYWAETPSREPADFISTLVNPDWVNSDDFTRSRGERAAETLREVARKVKTGAPLDAAGLAQGLEDARFYVLGLGPNAARLVVRFFHAAPFFKVVERIMAHYADMAIEREYPDQPARIPPWMILEETFSKKSREKQPSPLLPAALMRSIFEGTPYPAALYYAILNRIRVDADDKDKRIRKINYTRAAVIKAYLTRKYRQAPHSPIQEVLSMTGLNEQSTYPAYLLGRLFAVLEKAQADAIGDANATIKDRYFTTACASPASVFPVLLRLAQHHISKADYGYVSDRRIQDILNCIEMDGKPIPARLSLDDQGIFVLGYYHQRAALYAPRKDKSTEAKPSA